MSQLLWIHLRHVLELLVWAAVLALATAAGAWCCGYAVREAWLKAGPPRRRTLPSPAVDEPVAGPASGESALVLEAQRGIHEIEKYLAENCPQ